MASVLLQRSLRLFISLQLVSPYDHQTLPAGETLHILT